jgi:hypothetical protein
MYSTLLMIAYLSTRITVYTASISDLSIINWRFSFALPDDHLCLL